jgi:hypothetical protein
MAILFSMGPFNTATHKKDEKTCSLAVHKSQQLALPSRGPCSPPWVVEPLTYTCMPGGLASIAKDGRLRRYPDSEDGPLRG